MNPIIRKREVKDSLELAHCIAIVWNTTYKGIVADEFLEGLLKSEKYSAERLKSNIEDQPYYFVLTLNDKIIGWIYYTLETEEYENSAEIHSLYVLKEYQGKGYGKMLFDFAIENILKCNLKNVIIGCLDGNPSNEFYKHLGGKYIKKRKFRDEYWENIYLFQFKF